VEKGVRPEGYYRQGKSRLDAGYQVSGLGSYGRKFRISAVSPLQKSAGRPDAHEMKTKTTGEKKMERGGNNWGL